MCKLGKGTTKKWIKTQAEGQEAWGQLCGCGVFLENSGLKSLGLSGSSTVKVLWDCFIYCQLIEEKSLNLGMIDGFLN